MSDLWRSWPPNTVPEKTTASLRAVLVDEKEPPAPIPATDMDTIKLTLCVKATGAIINNLLGEDVFNAGIGTFDPLDGTLVLTLRPDDNVIVDLEATQEEHVALLEYTWEGGAKAGKHEVIFTVVNLDKVA